jgi:hypothetical protein
MSIDRRRTPRWRAPDYQQQARVQHEDGTATAATVLDVSATGIGIRAERLRFAAGMRARLRIDLLGESFEIGGGVRFVDRFFPRVGLQIDTPGAMDAIVARAESCGFLMSQLNGDTLSLSGRLTLAATREFHGRREYRKLDLSGVTGASVAGAAIVASVARNGARIDRCSEFIAPIFDSLGICGARLCVSATPCDLPKAWPVRGASPD